MRIQISAWVSSKTLKCVHEDEAKPAKGNGGLDQAEAGARVRFTEQCLIALKNKSAGPDTSTARP